MNKKPLVLRNFVCKAGYRWVKIDARVNRKELSDGKWITRSFKIAEPMIRTPNDLPERTPEEKRSGYYLTSGDPFHPELDRLSPGELSTSEPLSEALSRFFVEVDIEAQAPVLFRELADTPCTPEGIQGFAIRWGLLGGPNRCRLLLGYTSRGITLPMNTVGEPAKRWAVAIYEMRNYVRLWDLIRKGDAAQIPEYLWVFDSRHESIAKVHRPKIIESFAAWNSGDLLDFAQTHLWQAVNTRLSHTFSPQLTFSSSSDGRSGADGWQLHFEPECLLDGLWFQFALAIRGNIEHRQCIVCAAWFEITSGSGRRDKRYCSVACQMRAYRKRKAGKP